jgi:undecaprenyl pyrophosphate phosphatase UppP
MPLVGGVMVLDLVGLVRHSALVLSADLQIAALVSGLCALLGVAVMMAWVERRSFTPFVVLRLALGAVALGLALGR